MKKVIIPLYLRILIGMIVGIVIGIVALAFDGGVPFINAWIKPWGQVFIKLLQLIAVPLVFASLVKGVTGLQDISRFAKIGMRTVVLYITTTLFAISVGLIVVLTIKPGNLFDSAKAEEMQQNYQEVVAQQKQASEQEDKQGPLAFLNEVIPDNIVSAAGNNRKMLQVIFFAVLFGLAALSIPRKQAEPVLKVIDSIYDIILKMVDFIINLAPYGVFALMAALVTDYSGDLSVFGALGLYAVTVITGLLLLMFVFYPTLVHFFTRIKVSHFIKSMYPVQLLAFTTSSSSATLPLNLETTEKELKVSNEVTSFVLPVGTTINMDGTSCYQAVAVVFIAQVMGIELGLSQMLSIILLTTISSIGTPGIPGGSYVILTMVLSSVGIPAEGLALILGIDRPLDMLRTAVNVTGDATVAAIVDKQQKPL
ncbi:dicarboxylate/amino acid:cation symporter [Bacteroides sp. OttesenSCG-928-E20]|nr:dicarboxylate/amino acid:cation symporter [Bacteroides sp. OttesenSCG-928-E20]